MFSCFYSVANMPFRLRLGAGSAFREGAAATATTDHDGVVHDSTGAERCAQGVKHCLTRSRRLVHPLGQWGVQVVATHRGAPVPYLCDL